MLPEIAAGANLGVGVIWFFCAFLMWMVLGGLAGSFSSMHAFLNSFAYFTLYFFGPMMLMVGSIMFIAGRKSLLALAGITVSSVGLISIASKTLYDLAHPVPLEAPSGYSLPFLLVAMSVITGAATTILLLDYIQIGKSAVTESNRGA